MTQRRSGPCQPHHLGPRPQGRLSALRLEGRRKEALETGRTRLLVAGIVFALAFAAIGVRVLDLAVFSGSETRQVAQRSHGSPHATGRADIVDRQGRVLATSLSVASLSANPREVIDPARAARRIAEVLPSVSVARTQARLESDQQFVWIKRHLTPRQQDRINRLGIPGLYFKEEERRFYPYGDLTAHVVGFTDLDSRGIAGIESSFDELLSKSSRPLRLSLDVRIQHLLTDELRKAMQEFDGIGAAGLVLDVRTGELLAMSSLPSFDPQNAKQASDQQLFNRATLGVYEMGSTFKIFSTAAALDSQAVGLFDSYDVSEPIRAGGFTIRDYKPKDGVLSVPEIFMHSSNIGTVKMAMDAGTEVQRETLDALGLTEKVSLELQEVGAPMTPGTWREINTMTASYGHGIAVNAVQLASAVAATVNHGRRQQPTLLARDPEDVGPGTQVFQARTSQQMRRLMRLVVEYGTGKNADAEGYRVGGKTGTADKQENGRYRDDARISSFVGAFPMDDPRYVVFAMVDEPKGQEHTFGYATGGWVAAPVVKRVIERMGPMLGLEPQRISVPEQDDHPLLIKARSRSDELASN
jgi:cell division protein FtsI (penicillin-binding protein 3)